MRIKRFIIAATLAGTLAIPFLNGSSRADINSDLSSFWNDLGGVSNVTGPTSFQSQAASNYTLGSVSTRIASRNAQISGLQLPSIEAGCGGINVFSGSLSIISSDELIQMAKSIIANAQGYAFDLALETLSPQIAETMKALRDFQQKLNLANINSCETAKGLVNAVWPKNQEARRKYCAELGASEGKFTDYAAALNKCSTESEVSATNTSLDPVNEKVVPEKINLAWDIIHGDQFGSGDWLASDTALSEIVMSMTGTIIIDGDDIKFIVPVGHKAEFIEWLLKGGSSASVNINILKCSDTDKCLNPQAVSQSISLSNSIHKRVSQSIDRIIQAVQTGGEITVNDQKLVNATTIPLYRIMNVYAAYSGPVVSVEIESLKGVLSNELAIGWAEQILNEVLLRTSSTSLANTDPMLEWKQSLRDLRVVFIENRNKNDADVNRALQIIERVKYIETYLASRFGNQTGGSIWDTLGSS